jgi:PIN domain nuclease of toxin-antitoxin system
MRLIIDTHALIWFATGHRYLSQRAKASRTDNLRDRLECG